jgi:hypothetical protein
MIGGVRDRDRRHFGRLGLSYMFKTRKVLAESAR